MSLKPFRGKAMIDVARDIGIKLTAEQLDELSQEVGDEVGKFRDSV